MLIIGSSETLKADSPVAEASFGDAIKRELELRKMTPYRLWKEAMSYCPTLSQSAVDESQGSATDRASLCRGSIGSNESGVTRQEERKSDAK